MSYSKRVWLNPDDSPSTGSVVAFYGAPNWKDDDGDFAFLEVSSCHRKVRLHKTNKDTLQEFADKMRKLAEVANNFADFLESDGIKNGGQ